jgi:Ca2+/Na+ antiporter
MRLPFPWILWTAVNQKPLGVSSKGAACSISMLFLMLILVFLAILSFKWKMTKSMGGIMLVLYVIFVIVSLGFSFQWYECPV